QKDGVFAVHPPEQGHQLLRLLPIAPLPGQDNHHPVAAYRQRPLPGNGVGAAPVQIGGAVIQPDGLEQHGHGACGLEQEEAGVPPGDLPVLGPAGLQVGDHRLHLTGIRLEGVVIKGHQLVGDGVVGELQPEVAAIPGIKEIPPAHVPPVIGVVHQQLEIPPLLPGEVADAVGNPGRDADGVVRHGQFLVQKSVAHAGREDRPQRAALQHQTCFHGAVLPFCVFMIFQQFFIRGRRAAPVFRAATPSASGRRPAASWGGGARPAFPAGPASAPAAE
ncbi:RNA-binding cell elongation regulator Jag/EloR, partial [Dysosmobacter welbionis]